MKCIFCGSENLKITQTLAHDQNIVAYTMEMNPVTGEVHQKPFELSVTRRRIKCLNCNKNFASVEHFERSTTPGSSQQYIISNLTFVNDSTDQMRYNFTQEEKDRINALMREM